MSALLWLLVLILATPFRSGAAEQPEPEPAKLKVSGYGFLGNLRLKRVVRLMAFGKEKPAFFDANFIEDSALILSSKLQEDGHLEPVIRARITLDNGRVINYAWTDKNEQPLERPLRARAVQFIIRPGALYHYTQINFSGLTAIPPEKARSFFIETSGLLSLRRYRVYSPRRLNRSVSNLEQALTRLGYRNAHVTATNLVANPRTGGVRVQIVVQEGKKFVARSMIQQVLSTEPGHEIVLRTNYFRHVYSRYWEDGFVQSIKTNFYRRGFPDVTVDLQPIGQATEGDQVFVDLRATVHPGQRVRVGKVEFEGNERTRPGLLRRRVPIKPNELLNRIEAERGRYQLSRLGVFDSVELRYEAVNSNLWDVTYQLDEGKRITANLLFGFGSYDLLRGGVELNHYNLWGLAQSQQLKLVQSFKSSSGSYLYTIPQLLGPETDLFLNASGLRREEISFTRLEYGGGIGVHRVFPREGVDVTVRYSYGILEATESAIVFRGAGVQSPAVGEIIGDVRFDRLDNRLDPHRGYDLLANVELATRYLGGDATFQRVEVGGAYHWPLNDSEWIHIGIRHGVVSTVGATRDDLPFVRRFFPGGAHSVRGYKEGEAAPKNAFGQVIGAETYLSGNVEFEQALTPKWSLVAFIDGVGFARDLGDYPANESLFSAGGGLRWRTIVGPVRLEYGHNLNPRSFDPSGTLQFSVGFPF